MRFVSKPLCWNIISLAVLMIAACGGSQQTAVPTPPDVTVANPVEQEITKYLEVTGTTSALESVDIRARVSGFLEKVSFVPGSRVKAGELLYAIDPRSYQTKVEHAEATLESSKGALELAEVQLKKARDLVSKAALSEFSIQESTANMTKAKAAYDQAVSDLKEANLNLEYTQIKSPIDGQVGFSAIDQGNLVLADSQTILTTVQNDSSIYVYFNVSELALIPYLRKATQRKSVPEKPQEPVPAFLGLGDEKGYPFEGRTDARDARIDRATGTIRVRAVFANPDGLILPGMFVRVRIPTEKKSALLVPEEAIQADQGGKYVLLVNDQGVVDQKHVRVGQAVGHMRAVEDGLTPDDRVIVNGLQRAIPGTKVNPGLAKPAASLSSPQPSKASNTK
jgi:membrane fusion protein, multidrug efflux system